MSSIRPQGHRDVSPENQRRLHEAQQRHGMALELFARFLVPGLHPCPGVAYHHGNQMANAHGYLERAEDELWRLREEILGWGRPRWDATDDERAVELSRVRSVLDYYEERYGVPSERMVEAFTNQRGELRETEGFHAWDQALVAAMISGHRSTR